MSDYYYVANDGENMYTERRSKFLTVLAKAETEEKAREILDSLKSQYHDATHVCYAYRIGDKGECVRFSDGGEPSGTAGAPILAALTENECTYTLAAVIRWFGGVKLGAGGLTRAYHAGASGAIAALGKTRYEKKSLYKAVCPISLASALMRAAQNLGMEITDRRFGGDADFTVAVPTSYAGAAESLVNAALGKISVSPLGERYVKSNVERTE